MAKKCYCGLKIRGPNHTDGEQHKRALTKPPVKSKVKK